MYNGIRVGKFKSIIDCRSMSLELKLCKYIAIVVNIFNQLVIVLISVCTCSINEI